MEKEKDREKNKKKRGFSTSILGGGVVGNFSVKVQTVDILFNFVGQRVCYHYSAVVADRGHGRDRHQ